jgi:hypothetical protein
MVFKYLTQGICLLALSMTFLPMGFVLRSFGMYVEVRNHLLLARAVKLVCSRWRREECAAE